MCKNLYTSIFFTEKSTFEIFIILQNPVKCKPFDF